MCTKKLAYASLIVYIINIIVNNIKHKASNSNINFQLDFNHFPYGISKYESIAIKIILVGANNVVNP